MLPAGDRRRLSDPRGVIPDMSAPHVAPAALIDPGMRGVVRVVGGAGTGKSTLLIQTAAAHIAAGTDPESVLLLTGSARMSAQARAAITSPLLQAGGRTAIREPLVRTVHSYAFAVLRLAAQRQHPPREGGARRCGEGRPAVPAQQRVPLGPRRVPRSAP